MPIAFEQSGWPATPKNYNSTGLIQNMALHVTPTTTREPTVICNMSQMSHLSNGIFFKKESFLIDWLTKQRLSKNVWTFITCFCWNAESRKTVVDILFKYDQLIRGNWRTRMHLFHSLDDLGASGHKCYRTRRFWVEKNKQTFFSFRFCKQYA